MMKRYIVFAYDQYYPGGGWTDFKEAFETLAEARSYCDQNLKRYDYWHIVDLGELKDVSEVPTIEASR